VTYACNRPLTDVCLDLVDVLAINRYPGWYHCGIEDLPDYLDEHMAHLDGTGHAHKPIIVSEIGGGAIRGWRDAHRDLWSEQYQAELLEKIIRHLFLDRQRVCGLSIWQFCDCRTSELSEDMLGRPRGYNNKGVVDEYRRPKIAYDVVKCLFHALNGEEDITDGD
jgi:beta-glucuronidase